VKFCHIGENRVQGHSIHDKFNKDSREIDKWYSADRRQRVTNSMRSGEAIDTAHRVCVISKILLPVKKTFFIEEEGCYIWLASL